MEDDQKSLIRGWIKHLSTRSIKSINNLVEELISRNELNPESRLIFKKATVEELTKGVNYKIWNQLISRHIIEVKPESSIGENGDTTTEYEIKGDEPLRFIHTVIEDQLNNPQVSATQQVPQETQLPPPSNPEDQHSEHTELKKSLETAKRLIASDNCWIVAKAASGKKIQIYYLGGGPLEARSGKALWLRVFIDYVKSARLTKNEILAAWNLSSSPWIKRKQGRRADHIPTIHRQIRDGVKMLLLPGHQIRFDRLKGERGDSYKMSCSPS